MELMSPESKTNAVRLAGVGSFIPARRITNRHWEELTSTTDEWIQKNVGIIERSRIGADQTTADMGAAASLEALAMAGVEPAELDQILCATNSQDDLWPSTASKIQEKIGAVRATSMDLQAGCSGWVFAMRQAQAMLLTGEAEKVLVVGSDALSRFLNYYDRDNLLFGDGSGACVLTKAADRRLPRILFETGTVPSRALSLETIYTESQNAMEFYLERRDMSTAKRPRPFMDGRLSLKLALTKCKESMEGVLALAKKHGIEKSDIAHYVPHQTNIHVLKALADFLGFPMEKIHVILTKYGGISTASIPAALSEMNRANKLRPGDLILSSVYGAGFTHGAMIYEWG
jgi:3-oxoacyl-[acyl-carrier-protein] synthase-3